jgi:hypothetical protein
MKAIMKSMKFLLTRTIGLVAVAGLSAWALSPTAVGQQNPGSTGQSDFQARLKEVVQKASMPAPEAPPLTRFDLNFPGGTPEELAQAIEKASGKPLNLVIPLGAADTPLPPLKMRGVTVPELFNALQAASQNTSASIPRQYGARQASRLETIWYVFQTADKPPTDSSVWYFSSQRQEESKAARFWQLGPYLEDYTVDDITTAIQTGYKMLGDSPPAINFHQDTKLLIAVGEQGKLALIDAVLEQLAPKGPPAGRPAVRQTGQAPNAPAPTPVTRP